MDWKGANHFQGGRREGHTDLYCCDHQERSQEAMAAASRSSLERDMSACLALNGPIPGLVVIVFCDLLKC